MKMKLLSELKIIRERDELQSLRNQGSGAYEILS